jgi:hypothetical protein
MWIRSSNLRLFCTSLFQWILEVLELEYDMLHLLCCLSLESSNKLDAWVSAQLVYSGLSGWFCCCAGLVSDCALIVAWLVICCWSLFCVSYKYLHFWFWLNILVCGVWCDQSNLELSKTIIFGRNGSQGSTRCIRISESTCKVVFTVMWLFVLMDTGGVKILSTVCALCCSVLVCSGGCLGW